MGRLKKSACAALSVALSAAMLTSCSAGRYCMSYDDDKQVNSGIYIYNIVSEMINQQYLTYYTGNTESIMKKKVGDKEMAVYLEDTAMKNTKAYCAISSKFSELNLSLTQDETKSISDTATNAYNAQKDMFEEMGISKESIKNVITQSKMREKLFDYYYGKDGKEPVSDEDLEKYVNDNYLRFKTLSISKSTNSDETEKEKENKKLEATIDEYLKKAQGVSFDGFDDIIHEYEESVEAKSSTKNVGDSDSSSQSDSSAADSSTADSSTTDSSTADSSTTDSSTVDSSAAESGSDSSTTGETQEKDKYEHENFVNYSTYDEEGLKTDYGKLLTEVKGLSQGVYTKYSNDSTYYIIIKGDASLRSSEYVSENRDTVVSEMKNDDFDKMVEEWEEEINIKVNDNSIKRYSAKNLYKRYTDYTSKKS